MRRFVHSIRRQTAEARPAGAGQALVEFSLVLIPFVILLMGVIDLGRGIYMMNGTSEAARDINRATIVHLTDGSGNLGLSPETTARIGTQRALIPGLEIDPTADIACVDAYDQVLAFADCTRGVDFIRVHVAAPFSPVTPLVAAFGTHEFQSTSRMQIP